MLGNTYSASFIAERAYSACEFLISNGKAELSGVGAKLVVVTVPDIFELSEPGTRQLHLYAADPDTFDANYPHRRIKQICNELDIECVSAKEFLRLEHYNSGDRHWTAQGHGEIKKLLARLHAAHIHPAGQKQSREAINGICAADGSSISAAG
jgi:hypothetical protein